MKDETKGIDGSRRGNPMVARCSGRHRARPYTAHRPFVFDIDRPGCTLWPEGVWHHCCVAHDYAYADHAGEPLRVKWRIDDALRVCVAGAGHPGMAWLMFCGVSVFGLIPWYRYAAARG